MLQNQELLEITRQLASASEGMRAELTQMGQERFSPQDQIGMIKATHGKMEQAFDRSLHWVCDFQIHSKLTISIVINTQFHMLRYSVHTVELICREMRATAGRV